MKSVKTRILTVVCGLVSVSLLTLGIVSIFLNYNTTSGVLQQTMQETAKIAAERVSYHIRVYKVITAELGVHPEIASPAVPAERKQAIIDNIVSQQPDLTRGNILDANGTSIFNDTNYADREYFQQAIKGNTWISEPLISRVTGAISLIVAAPIWEGGKPNTNVVGVIYLVPTETFLNDIVSSIKISKDAGAYILDKKGTVIAHPNMDFVTSENNNQDAVKSDPSLKAIASIEQDMIAGNSGFGTYTMLGVNKFLAYTPVPDSNGWSIGVNAPITDFMSYTNRSIFYTIIFLVVFLTISITYAVIISNGIGRPLRYLSDILLSIAKTGQVKLDSDYEQKEQDMMKKKDEIGSIATAIEGLLSMLKSNATIFESIADGDLSVDVVPRSPEDALGNAMLKMTSNLNSMFSEITVSTEQVSSGAKQIADGSQTLAQGSTEQASAVEQLSASISDIAGKTNENANMASRAAALANTIKQNAEKGNSHMNDMMSAVKEINDAGQNINKVIKVIDDIAFQTNILALNAAVEAARAGQHGKGFAVVAEEVRNLATKSAEAARNTGELILNSIEKAELGVRIANETAASLVEIVTGINESSQIVEEIAHSSEQQATGISQINNGIEQVAQVVQQNSATAEESAAASEEMSSQAYVLEELIAKFKLKENDGKTYNKSNNSRKKHSSSEKIISLETTDGADTIPW